MQRPRAPHGSHAGTVRAGDIVGTLAGRPVIARAIVAEEDRHDRALAIARGASRARLGSPMAVVRSVSRTADASYVRYTVIDAELEPGATNPGTAELAADVVDGSHPTTRADIRVTDLVFGDVSMVVPPATDVNPWVYLVE